MNHQNEPKLPRQATATKAADTNQALIAAVSLLGASLGVTAATPADAGTADKPPQVQTSKPPGSNSPTASAVKSNSLKSPLAQTAHKNMITDAYKGSK